MERIRWITDARDVDELFKADLAILYKHSPRCGVCSTTLREVDAFIQDRPDAVVYAVDVVGQRDLSRGVAARTGITHESPQIIIFRRGVALWHDSHYGITADALAKQFGSARG